MDVSRLKSDFNLICPYDISSNIKKGVENQSLHQTACYSNLIQMPFYINFSTIFSRLCISSLKLSQLVLVNSLFTLLLESKLEDVKDKIDC